jgi:endonuclease/exonuclease/phosphatase family metal-dependent hydrolase
MPQPAERLRVLTSNVWGIRGDWPARRAVLKAGLEDLQPDLVAFIETIQTPEYDQAADLLGASYHLLHQANREPDGQGATIASRWPIVESHELDLDVTPRPTHFAATLLTAQIECPPPFGPILFANHMPTWQPDFEHERELQAVAAARFVETLVENAPWHVIFAGDFTADPDHASVRFLTGRQSLDGRSVSYRDAWQSIHPEESGATFTPANPIVADWDWPMRRIDYVLVRCGPHGGPTLAIDRCEVVFDKPVDGVWASDHFGVVADLVIPPERAVKA